jgi:hypothetical protein
MVADLVHQHMRDHVAKRLVVLGPVIEDRTAVQINVIGQSAAFGNGRILRQTDP